MGTATQASSRTNTLAARRCWCNARCDWHAARFRQAAEVVPGPGFRPRWMKDIGGLRKLRQRGKAKTFALFTFTCAAYNLVRLKKLLADPSLS